MLLNVLKKFIFLFLSILNRKRVRLTNNRNIYDQILFLCPLIMIMLIINIDKKYFLSDLMSPVTLKLISRSTVW